MSKILLHEVTPAEAVSHALVESFSCFNGRPWLFCAGLAMLRKALDIWSSDYRDRHGMSFDASAGQRDNLYWRLKKISDANVAYRETLGEIMDTLRVDGNDVLHAPVRCPDLAGVPLDAAALVSIPAPYLALHGRVLSLMTSAMPGFTVSYGPPRGKPTRIN